MSNDYALRMAIENLSRTAQNMVDDYNVAASLPPSSMNAPKVSTPVNHTASRKHGHYFKPVSKFSEVDVYRVCDLFQVEDCSGAIQHAIKKLLLPGQRGAGKDRAKDLQEAVDTLNRKLEMMREDAA